MLAGCTGSTRSTAVKRIEHVVIGGAASVGIAGVQHVAHVQTRTSGAAGC
jgi:hypothetical protein